MRITRLELRHLGPFDDAVFELPEPEGSGEVVLFEGPNGSGKTTIIEAIASACSPHGPASGHLREKALTPSEKSIISLQCAADSISVHVPEERGITLGSLLSTPLSSPAHAQLASFEKAARGAELEVDWAAFAYRPHAPSPQVQSSGPEDIREPALHDALAMNFSTKDKRRGHFGQLLTNLESARTRAFAYAVERQGRDGIDYHAVVRARRGAIDRIEEALSRFLDRSVKVTFEVDDLSAHITFDGEEIPIEYLGEGLRSSFAWLSDLLVRLERTRWVDTTRSPFEQEFWLLLDEVDESLHPAMQARVYPTLRTLFPRARIYATTHSPFVVASLGEGVVFPIRPDAKTRRVSGRVEAKPLRHGQSLAWVVEDVFATPSDFIDTATREALERHREAVAKLRRGESIDEARFRADRSFLLGLNDEVATVVAMREVPVRAKLEATLRGDEAAE